MSIRKNTWNLDGHYDLTNSGLIGYEESGYMYTWGYNTYATLGLNDRAPYSSPTQVPGSQWYDITTGDRASLATKQDGTLWAWGLNDFGQSGINTRAYRSSPTQIPGTEWYTVSSAYRNSFATKSDGTFWSWGYNAYGCLSQNNTTHYSSPVQIPGNQWNTDTLVAGLYGWFMTKTDGTLWTSGINHHGQLGQNSRGNDASSPIQIPGTQWVKAAKHVYTALATKTDGTLWGWGQSSVGEIGNNNKISISSPVQIPGTQWDGISMGAYYVLATKTDNTLWSWGINAYGDLGQNNVTYYSSPRQIPGTQWDGSRLSTSRGNSAAFKTDGTLWVWGRNDYGQLGLNTWNTPVSSPIQIPGTQWSKISGALWSYNMVALKYAP